MNLKDLIIENLDSGQIERSVLRAVRESIAKSSFVRIELLMDVLETHEPELLKNILADL